MATGTGSASRFDQVIRIEKKVGGTGADSAGSETWEKVAQVSAEVLDVLPSRGERMSDGINLAARPARVRIRRRPGMLASMRFVLMRVSKGEWVSSGRIMQIVSGPALVDRRDELEFMVEDYSTAGNG